MSNIQTDLNAEADNIRAAITEDSARFDKLLKFLKGEYFVKDDNIPLGTEFIAYSRLWVKAWIKFIDKKVVDKKLYKVALGEKRPPREELSDVEKIGTDHDPWSDQYYLPLENLTTGEVVIFVTSTHGGHAAVRDLCDAHQKKD